jgi:hypothetical protein
LTAAPLALLTTTAPANACDPIRSTVAVGWGGATRASRCFARAPLSNMQVPDSAIF